MAKTEHTKRKANPAPPLTAHPLFPAVVALWFAALFGLSSLVVRVSLIEQAVRISTIDLILPAAAPPLGLTARILVALVMAAIGAVLGAAIARRIARANRPRRERKVRFAQASTAERDETQRAAHLDRAATDGEAPARRPLSIRDDFQDAEPLTSAAPAEDDTVHPLRHRALSGEERTRSIEDIAPLPFDEGHVLDLDTADLSALQAFSPLPQAEPEPEPEPEPVSQTEAEPAPAPVFESGAPFAAPADLNSFAEPASESLPEFEANAEVAAAPEPAPVVSDESALAGRQVFGLPPVAPSDAADRQIFQAPEAAQLAPAAAFASVTTPDDFIQGSTPVLEQVTSTEPKPLTPEPATLAVTAAEIAPPAPAESLPPLEDLGMVDLALRLQQAMARRRAERGGPPPAGPSQANAFAPPAHAQPAAQSPLAELPVRAEPAPSVMPAMLPAALRPIDLDAMAEEDADDSIESLLPRRLGETAPAEPAAAATIAPSFTPAPNANEAPGAADEAMAPLTDQGYASLLAVTPAASYRPTFVRIEEPGFTDMAHEPVVIFPGQAPRNAFTQPPAAPAPAPMPDAGATHFRRFDAPTLAGSGMPVAANAGPSALDPEETERSLRAALSNLQRIGSA